MQVLLNVSKDSDWEILLPLLKRLDVSFEQIKKVKKPKKLNPEMLKYHLEIIAKGGDATYFGDAGEWQRQERQERELPFNLPGGL